MRQEPGAKFAHGFLYLLLIWALRIGRFVEVFVHHAHEVIDLFARRAHGHVLGIL
jgi:hypothetical protein